MPLHSALAPRDQNIDWGWIAFPNGEYFIVRLCSIYDPDWTGFRLRKAPLKTLGMGFTQQEAEKIVKEHNDHLTPKKEIGNATD